MSVFRADKNVATFGGASLPTEEVDIKVILEIEEFLFSDLEDRKKWKNWVGRKCRRIK